MIVKSHIISSNEKKYIEAMYEKTINNNGTSEYVKCLLNEMHYLHEPAFQMNISLISLYSEKQRF